METITKRSGIGHQVFQERKKLEAVKSTLEDAAMQLGHNSEYPELEGAINRAIELAAGEAIAADDYLNDAA